MTDNDIVLQVNVRKGENGELVASIDKRPQDLQLYIAAMRTASFALLADNKKTYGIVAKHWPINDADNLK